jgi:hypothetical protein
VTSFNAVSLEKASIGFTLDIVQLYELASGWKEESNLVSARYYHLLCKKEKLPEED